MPRTTPEEERRLVEFAADLGFDTLVLREPTAGLAEAAHRAGLRVVAVVSPVAGSAFAERHPECLQRTLPYELALEEAIGAEERGRERLQRLAHRWFPLIQRGSLVCYRHPESQAYLKGMVSRALEGADGVAFDGFGFKNHYACFCDGCVRARGGDDPEILARDSEEMLIETSKVLYEHAKAERTNAMVMNHVWPPFDPNPYYGARLHLDYCTQTISWFYRPSWSLERVELEAAEHARLQIPGRNRFVPFIGLYAEPYQIRTPERVARELEIALRSGEGHVVLSTLSGPLQDEGIRAVVKSALSR